MIVLQDGVLPLLNLLFPLGESAGPERGTHRSVVLKGIACQRLRGITALPVELCVSPVVFLAFELSPKGRRNVPLANLATGQSHARANLISLVSFGFRVILAATAAPNELPRGDGYCTSPVPCRTPSSVKSSHSAFVLKVEWSGPQT